jgi:hypothetical protein
MMTPIDLAASQISVATMAAMTKRLRPIEVATPPETS